MTNDAKDNRIIKTKLDVKNMSASPCINMSERITKIIEVIMMVRKHFLPGLSSSFVNLAIIKPTG
jgi:hypothetical protein